MNRPITLMLAVVLTLTSVTLALARHSSAGGTTIIVCAGAGETMVTLDAQGNPMPSAHPCPDCLPALAAQALPAPMPAPMPPLAAQKLAVRDLPVAARGQTPIPATARGPPLMLMSALT